MRNAELNGVTVYVYVKINRDLTVTLKGAVNDPRDKMTASNIAESFREIKKVRNEILVAKKTLAPAPEIPGEEVTLFPLTIF